MGSIRVLSDTTINQIAAGEVVENPASVVKELIENSIDAEARSVQIEIVGGGFTSICISDNGKGMSEDDAILSIERHATSKIQSGDDLKSVATMGFRGEALASISSIANVKILTAMQGAIGSELTISGGKMQRVRSAARSKGTTIEVRNLFFNVPARRKFQKSVAASTTQITKTVAELCLAHPDVNLTLFVNGTQRLKSGEIEAFLGSDFTNRTLPLDFSKDKMHLFGAIGKPSAVKSSRRSQYIVVNGRIIDSPFISKTIESAYGTRLSPREYPIFSLTLEICPELVDVNVHPQKKEVRFVDQPLLETFLHQAVLSAFKIKAPENPTPMPWSEPIRSEPADPLILCEPKQAELKIEHLPIIGLKSPHLYLSAETAPLTSHLKERTGLVMVDLRAVEERVLFDRMQENLLEGEMQSLLIPITLNTSSFESESLQAMQEQLRKSGIGLRAFGDNAFVIDHLHPAIDEKNIQVMIERFMEKKPSYESLIHLIVQKRTYTQMDAKVLMKQLLTCRDMQFSPRGQPLFVHLDEKDIERLFKTH